MVKTRLSDDDYKKIYTKVPRLTVDILVSCPQGVILVWRDIPPESGRWHIPGGTVYFGETLAEAAKRVAKEDLGLDLEEVVQMGVIEYPKEEDKLGFVRHSVSVVMVSRTNDKVWATKFLENEKRRIFSRIPEPMHPAQREMVEKILSSM